MGEVAFPLAQSMVGLSGRFQPQVAVVAVFVAAVGMIGAPLLLPICRWTVKKSIVG
jgi:hypothetical protein